MSYCVVGGEKVELSERQEKIIQIVKVNGPITGEKIAAQLHLSRATSRSDLDILRIAAYLDARPLVGYFYTGKTRSELLAEKIKKYRVEHVYSVPVVVKGSASVYDAISMMFLEDAGTLFVVDEN